MAARGRADGGWEGAFRVAWRTFRRRRRPRFEGRALAWGGLACPGPPTGASLGVEDGKSPAGGISSIPSGTPARFGALRSPW